MRWGEQQDRLEAKTLDSIEEVSEFFGVEVPYYPEVYWIGKTVEFELLGLPKLYEDLFYLTKKSQSCILLRAPRVILLGNDHLSDVAEEAAHFSHLSNSKIGLKRKTPTDWLAMSIIIELFGFLGSKAVTPERKNPYEGERDCLTLSGEEIGGVREEVQRKSGIEVMDVQQTIIHSQGYGLAERIWRAEDFRNGLPPHLKKIFLKDFSSPFSAARTYLELKNRYWPASTR